MAEKKNKVMTIRVAESVIQNFRRALGMPGVTELNDNAVLNQFIEKSGSKVSLLQLLDAPYPELRKCWNHVRTGGSLTYEQIQLVSHFVRQAYIHSHYRPTLNASYLGHVVQAWVAIYEEFTKELKKLDRYFLSNLPSSSGGDHIPDVAQQWITDHLQDRVSSTGAEIASRNLDVALEELEPHHVNVNRMNTLLKPHLKALLKVAFRGCWLVEDRPSREVQAADEGDQPFPSLSSTAFGFIPKTVSDDKKVELSLLVGKTGVTGLMIFLLGSDSPMSSTSLGFNNTVELSELAEDVARRAGSTEDAIDKGTGYVLLSTTYPVGDSVQTSHALRLCGRTEMSFSHADLQRVDEVLKKMLDGSEFQKVLEDMHFVYGDI